MADKLVLTWEWFTSREKVLLKTFGFLSLGCYIFLTWLGLYFYHLTPNQKDCMISYIKEEYPKWEMYLLPSWSTHVDWRWMEFMNSIWKMNGCRYQWDNQFQIPNVAYCYVTLFNYKLFNMYN